MEKVKIREPATREVAKSQSVGYFELHPDANINYQLNRALIAGRLEDLRNVAPKIKNFDDWKRELLQIANNAESEGRMQNAFAYYRAAEFFMTPSDPDRERAYEKFISIFNSVHPNLERHEITYARGKLPAFVLRAKIKRATIVIHAGFDSFIEEFYDIGEKFQSAGFDVVMFDGPGQGSALKKYHVKMTHEWEKPVGAILDHFNLQEVALIGISLGGYLAPRAAAFDRRIKQVVAFDVLSNFFDCVTSRRGKLVQMLLRALIALKLGPVVNFSASQMMKRDLLSQWGITQGMYVTGTSTPYKFLKNLKNYNAEYFSHLVQQDVLLLAGSEDHFVPLQQFYHQAKILKSARSLTTRLFTRAECGQSHCQIGNLPLVAEFICRWLDERLTHPDDSVSRGPQW